MAEIELPETFNCAHSVVLEELDSSTAAPYLELGLEFAARNECRRRCAQRRLEAAFAVIGSVPGLAKSVGSLVAAIHVLRLADLDYDISHSDPSVPFSVFVGMSEHEGSLDCLRVAEELVHECMHLQLSLLERRHPLTSGAAAESHHSPWQGRLRPTQGLLHGLYVFAVLDAFFAALLGQGCLAVPEIVHSERRRTEIAVEVSFAAKTLATSRELTTLGRDLVAGLSLTKCARR